MSWLEFKNGLLLKLVNLLQALAAVLMPKAHAPGLQEDTHPPAEDDFRAQWIKRHKTSRPPEDWLKLVAENSGSAGSGPIDNKVEWDDLPSSATQGDVKVPARAGMPQKIEPGATPGPGKQPQPSQQPRPKLTGAQLKSKQESPVGSAPTTALPHPPRIESTAYESSLVKQVSKPGIEPAATLSADQILERQDPGPSTVVPAVSVEAPHKPKQESWFSRTVRRIASKLRPAAQSSAIRQARKTPAKPVSTHYVKQPGVSGETDASVALEKEPQPHFAARGLERRKASISSGRAVTAEPLQVPRHHLSLPEQNEIAARYERSDGSEATIQTPLRRQRQTAAPVVPWPKPPVRAAGVERVGVVENGHGSIPVPASFHNRERNLTTAAASSWTLPPDQEIAPGLPSLPAEFRSSAGQTDNSEALYPWPELPQIVEEDADEPRKLLQNHERQLRVLREQRGAW